MEESEKWKDNSQLREINSNPEICLLLSTSMPIFSFLSQRFLRARSGSGLQIPCGSDPFGGSDYLLLTGLELMIPLPLPLQLNC